MKGIVLTLIVHISIFSVRAQDNDFPNVDFRNLSYAEMSSEQKILVKKIIDLEFKETLGDVFKKDVVFYSWRSKESYYNLVNSFHYTDKLHQYFMNLNEEGRSGAAVAGSGFYVSNDILGWHGDLPLKVVVPQDIRYIDLLDSRTLSTLKKYGLSEKSFLSFDIPFLIKYSDTYFVLKHNTGVTFSPLTDSDVNLNEIIKLSQVKKLNLIEDIFIKKLSEGMEIPLVVINEILNQSFSEKGLHNIVNYLDENFKGKDKLIKLDFELFRFLFNYLSQNTSSIQGTEILKVENLTSLLVHHFPLGDGNIDMLKLLREIDLTGISDPSLLSYFIEKLVASKKHYGMKVFSLQQEMNFKKIFNSDVFKEKYEIVPNEKNSSLFKIQMKNNVVDNTANAFHTLIDRVLTLKEKVSARDLEEVIMFLDVFYNLDLNEALKNRDVLKILNHISYEEFCIFSKKHFSLYLFFISLSESKSLLLEYTSSNLGKKKNTLKDNSFFVKLMGFMQAPHPNLSDEQRVRMNMELLEELILGFQKWEFLDYSQSFNLPFISKSLFDDFVKSYAKEILDLFKSSNVDKCSSNTILFFLSNSKSLRELTKNEFGKNDLHALYMFFVGNFFSSLEKVDPMQFHHWNLDFLLGYIKQQINDNKLSIAGESLLKVSALKIDPEVLGRSLEMDLEIFEQIPEAFKLEINKKLSVYGLTVFTIFSDQKIKAVNDLLVCLTKRRH